MKTDYFLWVYFKKEKKKWNITSTSVFTHCAQNLGSSYTLLGWCHKLCTSGFGDIQPVILSNSGGLKRRGHILCSWFSGSWSRLLPWPISSDCWFWSWVDRSNIRSPDLWCDLIQYLTSWESSFHLLAKFFLVLIYWYFPTQPTISRADKDWWKHPVSSRSLGGKALLMPEVRGKWPHWSELMRRHQVK